MSRVRRFLPTAVAVALHMTLTVGLVLGWGPAVAVHSAVARLLVAAVAAFGLLLVLLSLIAFVQVMALRRAGRRATATVEGGDERTHFRFTDEDGETHVVSRPVVGVESRFHPGDEVPLLYSPRRPTTFVLDRVPDTWGGPLAFLVVGVIVLGAAAVFAFDLTRWKAFGPAAAVGVGGVSLALGLAVTARGLWFRQRAVRTVGVITGPERMGGRPTPSEIRQRVVEVEFADASGLTRCETTQMYAAAPEAYAVGRRVPVWYDPDRPRDVRTFGPWHWAGAVGMGVLGAAFLVRGVLLLGGM
jgi:membrane protein implicated in regulation of membrane protease activity